MTILSIMYFYSFLITLLIFFWNILSDFSRRKSCVSCFLIAAIFMSALWPLVWFIAIRSYIKTKKALKNSA